jgi:hypothetical protein
MAYAHNLAVAMTVLFALVQVYPRAVHADNFIVSLLLAAFFGVVLLYGYGFLVRNFSRWMGGHAPLSAIRTAIGLGLAPWTVLFAVALIFQSSLQAAESMSWVLSGLFAGFVYGFVCLLLFLADVLKLSYLRTLAVMVIAFLVALFPSIALLQLLLNP